MHPRQPDDAARGAPLTHAVAHLLYILSPLKESHTDIVLDLLTLPSLEIVASSSMDHTIRLWDMHTGKARKTLTGHTKVRSSRR